MAKRVHVFDNDGEYRVHPPLVELDGSVPDILLIKNNTSEDIVVFVGPKAAHATDSVTVAVPQGKQRSLTVISQGAGNSNAYAYQVFAPKSGKKAKGNSDPVIIIEN